MPTTGYEDDSMRVWQRSQWDAPVAGKLAISALFVFSIGGAGMTRLAACARRDRATLEEKIARFLER
jgi:hypothetical protein